MQKKLEKECKALEKKEDDANQTIWQNENTIHQHDQEVQRIDEALARDSQSFEGIDEAIAELKIQFDGSLQMLNQQKAFIAAEKDKFAKMDSESKELQTRIDMLD